MILPEIPDFEWFSKFDDTTEETSLKKQYWLERKEIGNLWNFNNEIVSCVLQNTKILALGCLSFLKNMLELQNNLMIKFRSTTPKLVLHPFTKYFTMASFIFDSFKLSVLNDENIYALRYEYGVKPNSSQEELEYVTYLKETMNPDLITAFSNRKGQKKFKEAVPDAFCPSSGAAFFYNGCYYHPCPYCKRELLKDQALSHKEQRTNFLNKIAKLKANNSSVKTVTVMYGCKWAEMKETLRLKNFFSSFMLRPLSRLSPRESVRGARTELYLPMADETETFTLHAKDMISQYPFIALSQNFPVGKFYTYIGDELKNEDVEFVQNQYMFKKKKMIGLGHVTVLAPPNMTNPFLLYRISNHSLAFTCLKCATQQKRETCQHSENERCFTATYTIPEINLASAIGYKILKWHEVLLYEDEKPIFKEFLLYLAHEKLRHSGFPHPMTEQEKKEFCTKINEKMNFPPELCLTTQNVCKNKQKESEFKKFQVEFLGKFLQIPNRTSQTYVHSQQQLEKLFRTGRIKTITNMSSTTLEITLEAQDHTAKVNRKNALVIGSYIQALSRCQMMLDMHKLVDKGAKIVYNDCDCLMYLLPKNVNDPLVTGYSYGDYKNVCKGVPVQFRSLGTKCYSVVYKNGAGNAMCINKVRGLCLKQNMNCNIISPALFDDFVSAFFENDFKRIKVPQTRKRRNVISGKKIIHLEEHDFTNFFFHKRYYKIEKDTVSSFPYGYA